MKGIDAATDIAAAFGKGTDDASNDAIAGGGGNAPEPTRPVSF